MKALVLSLLVIQGLSNSIHTPTGIITGTIRLENGEPAVYLRVAAMRAENGVAATSADAGALFSQTQTDERGRYRLEGIPPGQYHVVAGRLDDPTFYVRAADPEPAVIPVASGVPIENIDFVIAESSARAPNRSLLTSVTRVGFQIAAEDGGPIPLRSPAGRLLLTAQAASISAGMPGTARVLTTSQGTFYYAPGGNAASASSSGDVLNDGSGYLLVAPGDYRFSLANLSDRYEVKAITYSGADVLKVPAHILFGGEVRVVVGLKTVSPLRTGTTVRGRAVDALSGIHATVQTAQLSQVPGTLFSDGSYEFTNIVPGRYVLEVHEGQPGDRTASVEVTVADADVVANAMYTTPPAAVRVKGRFFVEGSGALNDARVLLGSGQAPVVAAPDGTFEMTLRRGEYPLTFSVLPIGFMVKSIVLDAAELSERKILIDGMKGVAGHELSVTLAPIPRVRLRVRVQVSPSATRSVAGAHVVLSGIERHVTTLGPDGSFEVFVLPGDYQLEIHPFGFTSIREPIGIAPGSDIRVEFPSNPLY